jgi:hypothetical protein
MKNTYMRNYQIGNKDIVYEMMFEDNIKHQKKVCQTFKQSLRNEIESNHGVQRFIHLQ